MPVIVNTSSKIASSTIGVGGTRFLASGDDGALTVWNVNDGTLVSRTQLEGAVEIETMEDSNIAVLVSDQRLRLVEMREGKFVTEWIALGSSITQISFDQTSERFLAATDNGTVFVRWLRDGRELAKLKNSDPTSSAIFRGDGSVLTAAGTQISTWNTTAGTIIKSATYDVLDRDSTLSLSGEQGQKMVLNVIDLRLSPDGEHLLAICGYEGISLDSPTIRKRFVPVKVAIWNLDDLRFVAELDGGRDSLTSITVSKSGLFIAIGSHGGDVQVYTMDGKPKGKVLQNSITVQSISFSEDEKTLTVGGKADHINVWHDWELAAAPLNIRVGDQVRDLARFQGFSTAVFALSGNRTTRIWDELSGRPLTDPLLASGDIASALVDAKRSTVALVTMSGQVFIHKYELPSSNANRCALNKMGEATGGYVLNSSDLPVPGSESSGYQDDTCAGESRFRIFTNWFGSQDVAKNTAPTRGLSGDDYVKTLLADRDKVDLPLLTALMGWNPSNSCLRHWSGFFLSKLQDPGAATLASSLLEGREPHLDNGGCPAYE